MKTSMTLKNAKLVFKEFSNDSHRNRDRTILHRIVPCNGAVLVYRYTEEFLLFSYPYMELWRSSLMFRSFVYRYTRTQPLQRKLVTFYTDPANWAAVYYHSRPIENVKKLYHASL